MIIVLIKKKYRKKNKNSTSNKKAVESNSKPIASDVDSIWMVMLPIPSYKMEMLTSNFDHFNMSSKSLGNISSTFMNRFLTEEIIPSFYKLVLVFQQDPLIIKTLYP